MVHFLAIVSHTESNITKNSNYTQRFKILWHEYTANGIVPEYIILF